MRHHVSPNQLALWPHHELTEAWAPTGILHPSKAAPPVRGQLAEETGTEHGDDADEGSRGIEPEPSSATVTVLTRNGGVCRQAGEARQRGQHGRREGRGSRQPSRLVDLV
jgi:hypothetical protein